MSRYNLSVKRVRIFSVAVMLFAFMFGFTWNKQGFCFGDNILTGLGLSSWSNGTHGTHYTAIFALVLFLIAFLLFISSTSKVDHSQTEN